MPSDDTLLEPVAPVSHRPRFVPSPTEPDKPRTVPQVLVGEWLTRPLHLLWVAVLPQALLWWINLRAYHLASGEMNSAQHVGARVTGGAELALLVGCAALGLVLHARKKPLAWAWNWALLAAPVGYLTWVLFQFGGLFPSTVPEWIVSGGELVYYQFVLTMPLAFYAGLRLACFESDRSPWGDLAKTAMIGVTAIVTAVVLAFSTRFWPDTLPKILVGLIVFVVVAVTLLLLGAVMRTLAITYVAVRRRGPKAMAGLVFAVGVAGPVGGLLLNASVPFPVNLQSWAIYALAVVNGTLLLLPNHRHPVVHRLVWLSQCVTFAFSLYFFLVFLPLLPFCVPAMFYLGAGLLILVPSALFVVHAQRLVDGYRCEVRDGNGVLAAGLGIGAALVLPLCYVGGASMDRVVLRGALDYAYTPSYRADAPPFPGDPARVGRSLEHLRDYKVGLDLPFLTDLYKGIVFDGLVLPDAKMQHLYHVFLGRDLPEVEAEGPSLFGHTSPADRSRGRTREAAPRFVPPPPTDSVVLAGLEQTVTAEGPCDRAHITLTMENTTTLPGEFVTPLHLPEAVRVTGFWLHIGPTRVPGRLVERKTALWVYHRIRDAAIRRDPGLLTYTGPEAAELRVCPFAAHESRTVELELLYPAALAPAIQIGGRTLTTSNLKLDQTGAVVMTPGGEAGTLVTLTSNAVAKLPSSVRRPFLHFLFDRSEGSDADGAALRRAVQAAMAQLPEAREGLLTTVNYESREPFSTDPMPLAPLLGKLEDEPALVQNLGPQRGGFLQERALRRGLLSARDRLAKARDGDDALTQYPVFIVVRGSHTVPISEEDEIGGGASGGLKTWAECVPDQRVFYCADRGSDRLQPVSLDPVVKDPGVDMQAVRRVVLLRCGQQTVVCPAAAEQAKTLRFTSQTAGELSVFDPQTRRFGALDVSGEKGMKLVPVPSSSPYAQASEVFMRFRDLVEHPEAGSEGLSQIAALNRSRNVLTGATSFIVVENSAQWRILEEKEKQKLANAPALEIEAAPEPKTWVMIVLGGLGMVVMVRRARRNQALA